jgi:hypothetical protein
VEQNSLEDELMTDLKTSALEVHHLTAMVPKVGVPMLVPLEEDLAAVTHGMMTGAPAVIDHQPGLTIRMIHAAEDCLISGLLLSLLAVPFSYLDQVDKVRPLCSMTRLAAYHADLSARASLASAGYCSPNRQQLSQIL